MYRQDSACTETPAILKTFRRTNDSPRAKIHPPPSKTSYMQSKFGQIDSFTDDHQIIVFGFENKTKETVLQKFHKLGIIEDIKDAEGNSIRIKYRDLASAYKAAELHGHVLAENTMIGVKLIAQPDKKPSIQPYSYYTQDSSPYLTKKTKKRSNIWNKILIHVFNFDN